MANFLLICLTAQFALVFMLAEGLAMAFSRRTPSMAPVDELGWGVLAGSCLVGVAVCVIASSRAVGFGRIRGFIALTLAAALSAAIRPNWLSSSLAERVALNDKLGWLGLVLGTATLATATSLALQGSEKTRPAKVTMGAWLAGVLGTPSKFEPWPSTAPLFVLVAGALLLSPWIIGSSVLLRSVTAFALVAVAIAAAVQVMRDTGAGKHFELANDLGGFAGGQARWRISRPLAMFLLAAMLLGAAALLGKESGEPPPPPSPSPERKVPAGPSSRDAVPPVMKIFENSAARSLRHSGTF